MKRNNGLPILSTTRQREASHGFRPAINFLSAEALVAAIAANPYPDAVEEPKNLHLFFLDQPVSDARIGKMNEVLSSSESATAIGSCVYMHTPEGIGRSKFAGRANKILGTTTTARNWRTVMKIADIAAAR